MITYIVVVTYNRCDLLKKNIHALRTQTYEYDKLVIVNNKSTDNTEAYLNTISDPKIVVLHNKVNSGGAGGFAVGMEYAFKAGADFVWMMDDDALPMSNALEELMNHATPQHIYGSLAVYLEETSWATTLLPGHDVVNLKSRVPQISEVTSLPFLGYLVSKEIYFKLGLPDTSYFIAADDLEYCMRARKAGFNIYICGRSYINHPKSDRYVIKILSKEMICLKLVPWKRYYDVRNRLFIAKKYYGLKLYTQTIPSLFVRLLVMFIHEDNRYAQLKAFIWGFYDGLINNRGNRHEDRIG